MKPEAAIEWLNKIMPEWDYEANLYCSEPFMGLGEYVCTEPEGYVFKAAIEALEKQIPKEPNDVYGKDVVDWTCGRCGRFHRNDYKLKYCSECGQAVKWN